MAAYDHGRETVTFVSGESLSVAHPVTRDHVAFEIPTFTALGAASACVGIYASPTETGTFRPVREEGTYSAGAGILQWEVPSSVGGYIVECTPASRFGWIKVYLSTAATGGYVCYMHQHNRPR